MRIELHPRDPQQLGGHAAARCDDIGDHQVGRQVAEHRHVEYGHPRRPTVNSGPGVEVLIGGRQPIQRGRGATGGTGARRSTPATRTGPPCHSGAAPGSPTLAIMTELTGTAVANTRTVEGFLNALQDADYDAADAALDDNLVYENVGLPTIHGSALAMKLFRQMEGRAAFEVKIHRIAAEGAAVLTERTDALIFGRLRLQFWVCGVFEVHDGR